MGSSWFLSSWGGLLASSWKGEGVGARRVPELLAVLLLLPQVLLLLPPVLLLPAPGPPAPGPRSSVLGSLGWGWGEGSRSHFGSRHLATAIGGIISISRTMGDSSEARPSVSSSWSICSNHGEPPAGNAEWYDWDSSQRKFWCRLCGCYADDAHVRSNRHLNRAQWPDHYGLDRALPTASPQPQNVSGSPAPPDGNAEWYEWDPSQRQFALFFQALFFGAHKVTRSSVLAHPVISRIFRAPGETESSGVRSSPGDFQ